MQKQEIENLLNTRHTDEAEKNMQASDLPPAVLLPLRIRLLFLQNKYSEALELVEQMLHDAPNSAEAYRWKAEILDDGFHNFIESIKCSTRAIEIDANYAEAYVVRGNTKRWMTPADYDGAMEDYKIALTHDSCNSSAYSGMGWILLETPEKIDEALQNFTTALCHDSHNFAAYQGVSVCFFRKGKADKAIEYINKAIEVNPDAYYLYQSRAFYKSELPTPPINDICNDYCLAFQKSPCKKDFNYSYLFDTAYAAKKLEKVANLLWDMADVLPQREDILNFYIVLIATATDEYLNFILSKGISMEYQSSTGRVLFHELIKLCDCEIIRKFKLTSNLICKRNEQGLTPLAVAVLADKFDTGKYLLSQGSSADEMVAYPCMTPLAMAITTNKTEWINLFLRNGVNINHPLKAIGSYLSLACSMKRWEIAEVLLEKGANPNYSGLTGNTSPLRFCDLKQNKEVADKLLSAGARLEYSWLFSDNMIKKRAETLKKYAAEMNNTLTIATCSDFYSYLRFENLSDREQKFIKKFVAENQSSENCDKNQLIAMHLLDSCSSEPVWPEPDSYPLVKLLPKQEDNAVLMQKEETVQTQKEEVISANGDVNRQTPKKEINPGLVWVGFIPFWISTKSFIGALLITAGAYVVLCIVKSAMRRNSQ